MSAIQRSTGIQYLRKRLSDTRRLKDQRQSESNANRLLNRWFSGNQDSLPHDMRSLLLFWTAIGIGIGCGCQRKTEETAKGIENKAVPSKASAPATLVRLHFRGFDQLGSSTNASTLQEIWRLRETEELRRMALDKLAPEIATTLLSSSATTNDAAPSSHELPPRTHRPPWSVL